jgi:hypothetical protein
MSSSKSESVQLSFRRDVEDRPLRFVPEFATSTADVLADDRDHGWLG